MATELFKSFGTLQSELDQAKSYLKGVDENIKRLIGRDPSEALPPPPPAISNFRRSATNDEPTRPRLSSQVLSRVKKISLENNEPTNKKRVSVFQRLDGITEEDVWIHPPKTLISKVIVTPRGELPTRQEVLASRRTDEKSKARNKRMFGALLGTLQKFQQEETKLKSKEQKRAQVEKKIEDLEIKEKEEVRKERQELFFNRRKKLVEIKILEIKMMRMREFATWEQRIKPRSNFILTKTKPHIQYLPRRLNDATKALLAASKTDVEKIIEKRKQEVLAELQRIEERILANFELRNHKDEEGNFTIKERKRKADVDNHLNKDNFANEEAEIQDIINKVTSENEQNEHRAREESRLYHSTDKMETETTENTVVELNHTNDMEIDQQPLINKEQLLIYDNSKSRTGESD